MKRKVLLAICMSLLFIVSACKKVEKTELVLTDPEVSLGAHMASVYFRVSGPNDLGAEISLSENADMSNPRYFEGRSYQYSPNRFYFELYDLLPNTVYWYQISVGNREVQKVTEPQKFTTLESDLVFNDLVIDRLGSTSAFCSANVDFVEGVSWAYLSDYIKKKGVCWSTNHNPSLTDSYSYSLSDEFYYLDRDFTTILYGLSGNTLYYLRPFAITQNDTCYGAEQQFVTLQEGLGSGLFTLDDKVVRFALGNLQYQASTQTWRFADNQWSAIGASNHNIGEHYEGWIDLFGWGTSGYNHGAACYQPWSSSAGYYDYYAYGNCNYCLDSQTGQADWGFNPISNGGCEENTWFTLSYDGWEDLFSPYRNHSNVSFAKARVNGVNGVVVTPDDWTNLFYPFNFPNDYNASFTSNEIELSTWIGKLEPLGCVFLPAVGYRENTSVSNVRNYGGYWTSSVRSYNNIYCQWFDENHLEIIYEDRSKGHAVRLVSLAE